MKKFVCKQCKTYCWSEVEDDVTKKPSVCLFSDIWPTKWEEVPKLTPEVFKRVKNEPWWKYVTVNADGRDFFWSVKPSCGENSWAYSGPYRSIPGSGRSKLLRVCGGIFDSSDWKNSLVERDSEAIPDWCKVGAWVWHIGYCKYYKITSIGKIGIYTRNDTDGIYCDITDITPARVRSWTFEEAPSFLKTRLVANENSTHTLLLCNHLGSPAGYIAAGDLTLEYSMDWVTKHMEQLDRKPCGVLEHLTNGGEWVK